MQKPRRLITGPPQKETSEKIDKRNDIINALLHTVNAEMLYCCLYIYYNLYVYVSVYCIFTDYIQINRFDKNAPNFNILKAIIIIFNKCPYVY